MTELTERLSMKVVTGRIMSSVGVEVEVHLDEATWVERQPLHSASVHGTSALIDAIPDEVEECGIDLVATQGSLAKLG